MKLGSEVVGIKSADFRVPFNLYVALVGNSGAKKSPLRKLVVDQPVAPLVHDLTRAHSRAMEVWQEQNKGLPKGDRTDPPEPVFVWISSTTVEALAQQLQRQEGKGLGLLINRDELSGMFGSLGAYKSGRGDDEQFFLEHYDGGGIGASASCLCPTAWRKVPRLMSARARNTSRGGRFACTAYFPVRGAALAPPPARPPIAPRVPTRAWLCWRWGIGVSWR